MLFVAGIIILLLTTLSGVVYLGMRKGKLPAHGTREALVMYALVLGYLIGVGCALASVVMFAARWLP